MKCLVCGIEFETKRMDARYCSPKCRKEASRNNSIVTDNVTLSTIPVTLNFKFTIVKGTKDDERELSVTKDKVQTALYWYDVPIAAVPVYEKDWPKMPEYMNGRQYFLWWKNEFKMEGDKPQIHNPFPVYDKVEYKYGGQGSRHWGAA